MTKVEFLKRWHNDRDFRFDAKQKGIRVIGDNVVFLDTNGGIKSVAGAYIK